LAAAGINTLTVDVRGHGESGGQESRGEGRKKQWPLDLDAAFQYLISQPGVKRDVIGIGGAGVIGVENSVETARRHSDQVKSLVLLSGETSRDGLQFLRQASQLPELFVFSDDDEYPPIQQAMGLLYVTAYSPSRKLVHYSASTDPQAQLFPEITASTIGQGFLRAGDTKSAIDVLKLVLLAYPDSADANENLAEAYLKDGQKDLARQHAEKALAILDAHTVPASS